MMPHSTDNEQQLRLMLETAGLGLWEWDMMTGRILASPYCVTLFGLKSGKFPRTYKSLLRLIHPEDLPAFSQTLEHSQAHHLAWSNTYRVLGGEDGYLWLNSKGSFFYNEDGEVVKMMAVTEAVTSADQNSLADCPGLLQQAQQKCQQLELALHSNSRLFQAIFNASFQFICLLSAEGNILEINQTIRDFGKLTHPEAINLPFWQAPWWSNLPDVEEKLRTVIARAAQGEWIRFEINFLSTTKTLTHIDFSLKPILDDSGSVVLLIAEGRDITEHKQGKLALQESEERFRSAFDYAPIGMALISLQGNFLKINRSFCEITGYTEAELLGLTLLEITHVEDKDSDSHSLEGLLQNNLRFYQKEKRYIHKEGHCVWVLLSCSLVRDAAEQPLYFIVQVQDITAQHLVLAEREQAEQRLKNSLQEKEILLREIHHRVKNNLHVVANLLDLQSDYVDDEAFLTLFADSQRRIQSMALIHEQLYQSENLRQVNFSDYIHRLADNIFVSCHEADKKINPVIEVDSLWLNLETAVPCGLLINEFLTNAFKHAFPEGRTGQIYIELFQDGEGWLHLQVSDDGIGLPPHLNWQQSSTLGLKLIRILSKQLKADVQVNTESGTSFTLVFKQLSYQNQF